MGIQARGVDRTSGGPAGAACSGGRCMRQGRPGLGAEQLKAALLSTKTGETQRNSFGKGPGVEPQTA